VLYLDLDVWSLLQRKGKAKTKFSENEKEETSLTASFIIYVMLKGLPVYLSIPISAFYFY
jgi:hypothetical protein